ncbi:ABC transporter ATP-binding protein [Paenibacillus ihuae]|uniref:ABC transporter ATP-binding protein n=1 Tax=Paenibacillus ihuae TaxID=1232431 RepID=UPI0006D58D0A|nr:ABC transporter ATP-binding protein [Paenibacillus ihuae]
MKPSVFEARGLTKTYRSAFALQSLDMTIKQGDIYGLIGENGAGKSTLMKIIGGLVHPAGGEISLFGQQGKHELVRARRRIGFLIETPSLYPHMNAKENLTFYCRIFGIQEKARIGEVLQSVALTDAGSKPASQYSLGMRQRLGLAIALLHQPEFLVLDEPVNGLDPVGIVELREILVRLAREEGVTILLSSHILGELQQLATNYGFIHKGKLIQEVSAIELLESAQTMISVATSCPAVAADVLKQELQLDTIKITGSGTVEIPREEADLERLMSVLLQQGIPVDGIQLSVPNLEHYYLKLIGGGIQ